jgi:AraC-like DNA-binding protein
VNTLHKSTANRAFPLFVHRRNTHRAERLFVSTLKTIQTLAQRCGIEPVILDPFATFIPVLGLHQ